MPESEENYLSAGGQKKLGNLVDLKDLSISDSEAIRLRGGGQSQINQLSTSILNLTVAALADLAADGDPDAETAIKILKQAKKKRDKYGGK